MLQSFKWQVQNTSAAWGLVEASCHKGTCDNMLCPVTSESPSGDRLPLSRTTCHLNLQAITP